MLREEERDQNWPNRPTGTLRVDFTRFRVPQVKFVVVVHSFARFFKRCNFENNPVISSQIYTGTKTLI